MTKFCEKTQSEFVEMLKNFYNEKNIFPEISNKDEFFAFAKMHQLLPLVFHFAKQCNHSFGEDEDKILKMQALVLAQTMGVQTCQTQKFANFMIENNLKFSFLKGQFVNKFYPPSTRSMGDIDVYFNKDDEKQVVEFLGEQGYKVEKGFEQDINAKKGKVVFELHNNLYWFGVDVAKFCKMDNSGFDLQSQTLIVVVHMLKHLANMGCGIRQILDFALLLKHERSKIDLVAIEKFVESLGVKKAYDFVLAVMDKWFETSFCNQQIDKTELEFVEQRILLNGIFGFNTANENVLSMSRNSHLGHSKTKNFWRLIFPTYEAIKRTYPKLEKHRFLLPFYHVHRIFKKGFQNKRYKRIYTMQDDLKEVDELVKFNKILGLAGKYYDKN